MPLRLALIGGEEFSDGFEDVHASLLKDTGRAQPRLVFLPTCAADDGTEAIEYWCNTAREKFSALGALVATPRVIDRDSANDDRHVQLIAEADLIYFGGGYPHVAMRILPNTRVMAALQDAVRRDVLIAGSSGGAMLLGARSEVVTPELAQEIGRVWDNGAPRDWDPPLPEIIDCLGWAAQSFCAPHFNRVFPWKWLERNFMLQDEVVIGLDEQTAFVSLADGQWEVRGRGAVTLIQRDLKPVRYQAGEIVSWNTNQGRIL